MTPTERQQLLDRIDRELYELSHGPLVKFPLFDEVGALTPGVLEGCPMSDTQLAEAENKLGVKLVAMVRRGDWDGLTKVARTVGHFLDRPERLTGKDRMHPAALEELRLTLLFFREHVDEYWTLTEIQQHLCDETPVRLNRKTLERWCSKKEGYGFPVKPGKCKSSKRRSDS